MKRRRVDLQVGVGSTDPALWTASAAGSGDPTPTWRSTLRHSGLRKTKVFMTLCLKSGVRPSSAHCLPGMGSFFRMMDSDTDLPTTGRGRGSSRGPTMDSWGLSRPRLCPSLPRSASSFKKQLRDSGTTTSSGSRGTFRRTVARRKSVVNDSIEDSADQSHKSEGPEPQRCEGLPSSIEREIKVALLFR
jgi:hypothetical protein